METLTGIRNTLKYLFRDSRNGNLEYNKPG